MKFKIHFIILNFLISPSIFCMELELDKQTIAELIQNQKDIVSACQSINPEDNNFLTFCLNISESCRKCLLERFNQHEVKVKIEALEDYLEKHPDHEKAFEATQGENASVKAQDALTCTRYTLLWNKLEAKKLANSWKYKEKAAQWVQSNALITPEATEYVLATYFIIMKDREKERKITGKNAKPVVVR